MEHNESKSNLLAGSIIAAALILGGAYVYGSSMKSGNNLANLGNQLPSQEANKKVEVGVGGGAVLGDPNAPVTIIEFADFQCPYCERMHSDSGLKIREEYVKTGKVKMVFRNFPLDQIHPFARPAALAGACAKEQGKFWAYHDELFKNQETLGVLDYVKLSSDLGLNAAQFKSCFDTKKYNAEIDKDQADGSAAGVSGTPATFINGKPLIGALPYATFKAEIEAALKAVK